MRTDGEAGAIKTVLLAWAAGVHAREIGAVLADHDPDLVVFDVVGPLQLRGLDAYRASWEEQFFPWHGGTGRFDLRQIEIRAGDRVAFATALIDCAGTEAGKRVAPTLRLTVGLEKRQGRWWVVHEHHSEPLPFDDSDGSGGEG